MTTNPAQRQCRFPSDADSLNNNTEVTLSHSEMFVAACLGIMRWLMAIKRNRTKPYGDPNLNLWGLDIESCAAEMLVGKYLGLYWHSIVERPHELPGDVGCVQVRHTPRLDGHLILHDRDADEAPFVLVVGEHPDMRLTGWIFAADGKQQQYWWTQTRCPSLFVPQSKLRAMAELKAYL